MLHSVTSALLLIASLFAGVRADDGSFDFNHECVSVPSYGEACLNFGVRTCGSLGLYLNITLDNSLIYQTSITDLTQQTVCQSAGSSPCYLCMGIQRGSGDKFVLEPGYAHICPTVITRCVVLGKVVDVATKNLNCLDVGVPCSSYTSCNDCTSTLTCGWCGSSSSYGPAQDSSDLLASQLVDQASSSSSSSSSSSLVEQGACLRRGRGATPFCSSCPSVSQPFFVNNNQCPAPASTDSSTSESFFSTPSGITLTVFICLIIVGIVVFFVLRWYTSNKAKNGYTHQLEMHDQDNQSAHIADTSVVDAEAGTMGVTTAGSLNSPISEADTYHPPTLKENQVPLVSHDQSDGAPDDL